MCFLVLLLLLGPRMGLLLYWLGWPARWDLAFDSFLVPVVGFAIAPWTTLVWVAVAPGGVDGYEYLLVGMGVLADVASMVGGGGWFRRSQVDS